MRERKINGRGSLEVWMPVPLKTLSHSFYSLFLFFLRECFFLCSFFCSFSLSIFSRIHSHSLSQWSIFFILFARGRTLLRYTELELLYFNTCFVRSLFCVFSLSLNYLFYHAWTLTLLLYFLSVWFSFPSLSVSHSYLSFRTKNTTRRVQRKQKN